MDLRQQEIHSLKVRIVAVESALKLSTKIIRDLMKGDNAKDPKHQELANNLVMINIDILSLEKDDYEEN